MAAVRGRAGGFGLEPGAEALREARLTGDVTPQRVRQIALNAAHRIPDPIEVPASLLISLPAADLACYDELAVCAS